jgi:hypothetical protein
MYSQFQSRTKWDKIGDGYWYIDWHGFIDMQENFGLFCILNDRSCHQHYFRVHSIMPGCSRRSHETTVYCCSIQLTQIVFLYILSKWKNIDSIYLQVDSLLNPPWPPFFKGGNPLDFSCDWRAQERSMKFKNDMLWGHLKSVHPTRERRNDYQE